MPRDFKRARAEEAAKTAVALRQAQGNPEHTAGLVA
jgi:hypothetical protein